MAIHHSAALRGSFHSRNGRNSPTVGDVRPFLLSFVSGTGSLYMLTCEAEDSRTKMRRIWCRVSSRRECWVKSSSAEPIGPRADSGIFCSLLFATTSSTLKGRKRATARPGRQTWNHRHQTRPKPSSTGPGQMHFWSGPCRSLKRNVAGREGMGTGSCFVDGCWNLVPARGREKWPRFVRSAAFLMPRRGIRRYPS